MASTTQQAVYESLLTRVEAIFTSDINAAHIYVTAAPVWSSLDAEYIQIVPGSGSTVSPDSASGEVRDEFRVFIYGRVDLDQFPHDTIRITHSTYGIMRHRATLRGDRDANNPTGLIQHILLDGATALLHEPITLRSWSSFEVNPDAPSWVRVSDSYRMGYEL